MENYLDCQLPIADECNIDIDKEPLHVFRNNTSEEIPDKLAIYNPNVLEDKLIFVSRSKMN